VTPLHDPPPPFNVIWMAQVDSTNLLMQRRLDAWEGDAPMAETLLVAGSQWAGRGRGQRRWVSPQGGLYATWLGWVDVELLGVVPIAAPVALAEALEAMVSGLRVGVKWPNDLMAGGKKLGGVLSQARVSGTQAGVIAGFGVNLAITPAVMAGGVTPTSAAEWGWKGDPVGAAVSLAVDCVVRLRSYLKEPAAARAAWLARSVHRLGDELCVRAGDEVARGRFAGFGDAGQLRLAVDGGEREFFAADLLATL